MRYLYEYMSDNELTLAQESAINENAMAHLNAELETLMLEHEVRMNDIEMQILVENGTEDDLQAMYEKEYTIMTEGVSEWWQKFKERIKQIWNAILGKFDNIKGKVTGDSANDVIEVNGNVKGIKKFLNKLTSIIKGITNFKTEDGSLNTKKLAATIGIAVGGGVTAAVIFKKLKSGNTKMTKQEAEKTAIEMKQDCTGLISTVDSMDITDQNDANIISQVVNGAQSCVDHVCNSIAGLIGTAKGTENDPLADNNSGSGSKAGNPNRASYDKVANRNNMSHQRSGRVQDSVTGNKVAIYPPKDGKGAPKIAIKTPDGRAQTITKRQLPNFVKDRSVLNDMYAIYKDMESGNKNESTNTIEDFNIFNESAGWKAYLSKSGAIVFEESVYSESTYDDLFEQYGDLNTESFLESSNDSSYDELLSLLEEI